MSESKIFDPQRMVVAHMVSKSWSDVPHVSYLYEPDISEFYKEFRKLGKKIADTGQEISFHTVMIRVIVEGLKSAPKLNALISYNHRKGVGTLNTRDDINVSIPWLTSDGRMITPVISHIESMTLAELSVAVSELGKKIANTNTDELLYRAIYTDTLQELKKFHLSVIRRIFAAKISPLRMRGLRGKKKPIIIKFLLGSG